MINTLSSIIKTTLNGVENFLKAIVITLIGFMLLWVCAMVPARYLFDYTPSYGEELSRYLFVWVVFLTLPVVAKAGGHMAIETITSRISGLKLKVARICADLFSLIFLAMMTYYGVGMVIKASFQTSPGLGIPMSYIYLAIPIGCGVMFLNVLASFVTLITTPATQVK